MSVTTKQLENLRRIAEGAALSLTNARKRYEANKPIYQDGYTPSWLTTAETYYAVTRRQYEEAEAQYKKDTQS